MKVVRLFLGSVLSRESITGVCGFVKNGIVCKKASLKLMPASHCSNYPKHTIQKQKKKKKKKKKEKRIECQKRKTT
jgi:hypothetical protein